MEYLLQSSSSGLSPVLGSLYNFKSLSLQMGLSKLQKKKGFSEGGVHAREANAKQLWGFFFLFCEDPVYTLPYSTQKAK